jgi:hypothetical protein
MIADFIEIKQRLDRHFRVLSREVLVKMIPLAAMIPTTIQHEGHQTQHGERRTDYEETTSTVEFFRDAVPGMTLAEVERMVIASAQEVAAQVERGMFKTLESTARERGQMHEGAPLTPHTFLDALERMEVDFDEDREKPRFPTIFAGPAGIANLEKAMASMSPEESAAHEERKRVILDRKYAEYLSREDDRRLAD